MVCQTNDIRRSAAALYSFVQIKQSREKGQSGPEQSRERDGDMDVNGQKAFRSTHHDFGRTKLAMDAYIYRKEGSNETQRCGE